jgi:hypothetical protein
MKFIKTSATMILTILFLSTILAITPYVMASKEATGNGAPSGPHYNLNIIGVPKEKRGGTWDNNGHRIFVKLYGADTKIKLVAGDSFKVIDSDGTDGSAILQMMDPYPGDTTDAVYRIFVRALGKPGGEANMTSAFVDENGTSWYSLETVNLVRNKGKSRFDDKTLELTTIYVDMDGDGIPERYYLFDNELYDYFWNYDNNGLKLLQIRIYVN